MLALLMRWTAIPRRRRFLYAAVFVFGLSLTNSESFVLLAPAVVFWVMLSDAELGRDLFVVAAILAAIERTTELLPWFEYFSSRNVPLLIAFAPVAIWAGAAGVKARRIGSEWKPALVCTILFLAALAVSFYSAMASMTNPPLNWGYPRTVGGFYHLVTRGQYDRINPTRDLGVFIGQLWMVGLQIGRAFGWLYFVFMPVPFYLCRGAPPTARHWMVGLTAAFVCAGPVVVAMLNPIRERQALPLVEPYFSAMYVVLAIWTGLGLMAIGATMSNAHKTNA